MLLNLKKRTLDRIKQLVLPEEIDYPEKQIIHELTVVTLNKRSMPFFVAFARHNTNVKNEMQKMLIYMKKTNALIKERGSNIV